MQIQQTHTELTMSNSTAGFLFVTCQIIGGSGIIGFGEIFLLAHIDFSNRCLYAGIEYRGSENDVDYML